MLANRAEVRACKLLSISVFSSRRITGCTVAKIALNRRSAKAMAAPAQVPSPPVAKKVRHEMEMFGDLRIDNYYWLRDDSRSDPEMLSYLRSENAYTDSIMSGTKDLENRIFGEIRGRIKEDDITAPQRKGPYYYYQRTLQGMEYVQHCRRAVPDPTAPLSVHDTMPTTAPEHVLLDENLKAQGHAYYSIGVFQVSPNHKLIAYAEDQKGDEIYTVYVIDAETGAPVGNPLFNVTSYLQWAGDDALAYITMDEILRPDKESFKFLLRLNSNLMVWLHKLGTEQSSDSCLYHEKDDMFSLDLQASESKKFLFVGSESKNTRFVFYLDVSKPENGLMVLTPRVDGIDTSVGHRGDHFFIKRRSAEFYNSEVLACPLDNTSATIVLLPHTESVKIQDIQLFSDHLVVYERENGLPKVIVHRLPVVGESLKGLPGGQAVNFVDPIYSVDPSESEFSSSILRFSYSSLRTPPSVYDYDMNSGISVLKKIEP
ncbi:Peptidase S9A, N-terminal domain, partial [Dillenia turbinata]